MTYREFQKYRDGLQGVYTRLDDLDPFAMFDSLSKRKEEDADHWIRQRFNNEGFVIKDGYGIRDLLDKYLSYHSLKYETISIPKSVYPVYQNIASRHFKERQINHYQSYPCIDLKSVTETIDITKPHLLLVCHPLTPNGRSLTPTEFERINKFLNTNPLNHLLVDLCYDYAGQFSFSNFSKSEQITFFVSISKLFLKNGQKGWIISNHKNSVEPMNKSIEIDLNLQPAQVSLYEQFWTVIAPQIHFSDKQWIKPTNGYLSIVNVPFRELIEKHQIAAIPFSVFGFESDSHSVISILNLVKSHVSKA